MSNAGMSSILKWAGVALVVLVGLIHLIEAPEYFALAAYVGVLFVLNGVGAAASAYGIYSERAWGWVLGFLVSGGAFVAYIVSRTVGLPGAQPLTQANFFEPSGIISLIVEGLFVIACLFVLSSRKSPSTA